MTFSEGGTLHHVQLMHDYHYPHFQGKMLQITAAFIKESMAQIATKALQLLLNSLLVLGAGKNFLTVQSVIAAHLSRTTCQQWEYV